MFRKINIFFIAVLFITYLCEQAFSATNIIYVDPAGSQTSPYTNQVTACTTIQFAIDEIAAINGGTDLDAQGNSFVILICDGVYSTGTVVVAGYNTSSSNDILIRNEDGDSPEILNIVVQLSNRYVTFQGIRVNTGNGQSGIVVYANDVTVRGNEVYNVSGAAKDSGIVIEQSTSGNVMIVGNLCHDNTVGIRSIGDFTAMWSNICYDNTGQGIRAGGLAGNNIEIAQNRCYGNGIGIDIRGGSDSSTIFNNLCYGNTYGLRCYTENFASAIDFKVFQNTIYNNSSDGIYLHDNGPVGVDVVGVAIFNNLITHNGGYGVNSTGTVTYDPGLGGVDFNDSFANGLGPHNIGAANWLSNNISTNPQYISTDPVSLDFLKVSNTSPCIDRGRDSSAYGTWPNDFWGDPRPFDHPGHTNYISFYDIGADEFFVSSADLHHFVISHNTNAYVNTWEMITVTAKNSNGTDNCRTSKAVFSTPS